ncbi:MAG TPA: TetR/AcrR family transcriptional regulator C-terminal domain-containing protein [Thermoleophilia bacterium]|nr:TetR/AcrR family transcriptional regulator C-terminal domain-containing protein [Thermoleophilia bacterium]
MATPSPSDVREPLSRARVLRAGVDVADERGLERLSMRVLAGVLGVEAMSLYNHVANKDDLLDGMVDLVMAEIEAPGPDAPWREAMRRRAITSRAAYARHPWAARLVHTRPSVGPGRLASFDATIGCLRRAGFSNALTVHALSILDAYVHGFGAQRLHVAQAEVPDDVAMAEALARWLPPERYPYLSAVVQEHVLVDGYDAEEAFSFGLELVLGGLERSLAEPPRISQDGPTPGMG